MAAPRFAVRPSLAELWFVRGLPWSVRLTFYQDVEQSTPWDLSGHEFTGGLVVGGEVVAAFSTEGSDLAAGVLVLSLDAEQTDRATDGQWLLNDGTTPIFDGPAIVGAPGKAGLQVDGGSSADVTVHLGTDVVVVAVPLSGSSEGGTSDHTQLSNRDAPDQHPMEAVIGLVAALLGKASIEQLQALDDAVVLALAGKADSSALDAKADLVGGVIPTAQIPAIAVVEFLEAADEAAMLALDAQRNDVALRLDESLAYILMGDDPTDVDNWTPWPMPGAAVVSVNGQTGVIVLSAADVGAVPTSRTLAGLDLTENRSAGDLKTALAVAIADVSGLQAALDGKAPATRTIGTGLATSGTVDLDLATLNGTTQWITATGALTFTTSNRAAGRQVSLVIDAGASDRSLTWPGWLASGGGLPDEVEAGTRLHVSVVFLDSTDGAASAGWAVFA